MTIKSILFIPILLVALILNIYVICVIVNSIRKYKKCKNKK
ncbi:hypothetical protein [Clostridium ihumii]|nr:hypothetical protein [Clostridium ihumii]